jgi:Nif-specific regulatory protein
LEHLPDAAWNTISPQHYQTLLHIGKLLNAAEYTEKLIHQALDLVIDAIGAERGLFVRYETAHDCFEMIAGRSVDGITLSDLSQFSAGLLHQVVERKAPMLYHDVQSDPGISQYASVKLSGIRSVIAVPIFNRENLWGVILLDSREKRAGFRNENLSFLEFYANLVSLALDRVASLDLLRDQNRVLQAQHPRLPDLIGDSEPMHQLASLVHKVAPTDAGVLLLGESGTGKELVARAIHNASLRHSKTFLAQYCGSIPDTLLESELFGHKKGSFTGAVSDKKGLFEIASDGTFFLDEIADISLALQAKLLRILQNQELLRLGETVPRKVNVRIIAATHQDLGQLCKEGRFRHDLYYRLNVFPIRLPALRDKMDDLPSLTLHFIKLYSQRPMRASGAAMQKLAGYHWPGNVRQLENVIRRAIILCDGETILPEHIILEEEQAAPEFAGTLDQYETMLLKKRLQSFNGNRTRTAKSLGVSIRWVQLKLREFQN